MVEKGGCYRVGKQDSWFFGMVLTHVHEQFSVEKIIELKKQYPDADVLVYPKYKGAVVKLGR